MKKQLVLELLEQLPDEIDVEELMYRLYLFHKIEVAEADIEAGNLIPHEEVEREIEGWLQSPGPVPH